jgi:phenylpropionate dioxygenase-like ring-hydroxylating dioxygenase large terminal subunit
VTAPTAMTAAGATAGTAATSAPAGSPRFPTSWYPLCRSSELRSGRVLRRQAFGVPWAVFRGAGNRVAALDARCAHMGADLARGRVAGERLQCPLHHWEYGVHGRCERIPGLAAAPPPQARQAALACEEHFGLVFAFLGGEPAFPFPGFADGDPALHSRASVMSFPAPYQVLAANSFDSQHFATVHNRRLLAPPALASDNRFHLGVRFRARVDGGRFHDRLLRRIGVDEVELSAQCWGGNTILAYNHRTDARILFTVLPVDRDSCRIFVLNVLGKDTAAGLPRAIRKLLVAVMHRLTMAFLAPDVAVMRDLRWELGILLPDLDRAFVEWIKYWQALPTAEVAAARRERSPAPRPSQSSQSPLSVQSPRPACPNRLP